MQAQKGITKVDEFRGSRPAANKVRSGRDSGNDEIEPVYWSKEKWELIGKVAIAQEMMG